MTRRVTPTYTLINQITLAATANEITFSRIPQNFGDLVISYAAPNGNNGSIIAQFNGDTTNGNYTMVGMTGTGSSTSSNTVNYFGGVLAGINFGILTGSPIQSIAHIMDYSAIDKHKSYVGGSGSVTNLTEKWAVRWNNTAAISSIRISHNGNTAFPVGTTISLYGIVA